MTPFSFLKSISALVKAFIARVNTDGGIIEAARCIVKNTASLAMQPSGYKATKLYSQKPTSGVGDFTVDRNSTATRVNSLGLIESVAANVPRLDYKDGNCPSLLLEPQGTNLATRSEDFSNSAWVKAETSITSNTETAPDGTLTADTLIPNVSGNLTTAGNASTNNRLFAIFGSVTDITNSIYVKSVSGSTFNFSIYVQVNDSIKSIKTVTVTDKWQRVETSAVLLSEGNRFTVCTEENVYIWGAQAEQSSFATSYIPTSGSTVTRLADVVGGAGDVNTINSSEGVFYANFRSLGSDLNRYLILGDGGYRTNNIYFGFLGNTMILRILKDNVEVVAISTNRNLDYRELVVTWKQDEVKFFVDKIQIGSTITSFNTFSANTLNDLGFNAGGNGGRAFVNIKTKELKVYKSIADAQADLTYIN
jgi:hypothetical protein